MSQLDAETTRITSRRAFIQQIGVGSGALGLGMFAGTLVPDVAQAVCEPPGSPGTARPWVRDCRPIRPRRPASTLSGADVQKLRDAYQAMRALDASDPADPRGFQRQANVHCWYCGAGTQIHFSWQFFAWHRAYLYFHERILGSLIGDMNFRLPYWDWETASHRRIPGPYSTPAAASNPLWNSTRGMSATDEIPDEDVGHDVMEAALTAGTFAEFGGTASAMGIPEGAPHGSVHVDVNGDMGAFSSAARDPIFFAHHSNIDKMWSDWNKASSTHTNPTNVAFLNLRWSFYNESKVWSSISAAELQNHENQLRYGYGPSELIERLPCLLEWILVRTDWRATRVLKVPPPPRLQMKRVLESGGRVRLHLRALPVPLTKSAVYRLYADPETARKNEGPGSDGYLGTFPVVLSDREGQHFHSSTRDVVVILPPRVVERLERAEKALPLSFVERGGKGKAGEPLPVRAADVYFSVGAVER